MQISKAELTPDGISLTIPRDDARRFCYSFKPGEYDIKKTRKKRSLDANAYAWRLINDISLATRISPEEVYRGYSNVFFHMGSSDFDTRQMSMLIDNLIQDCRALDIETRPQDEIEALLEAWDGR